MELWKHSYVGIPSLAHRTMQHAMPCTTSLHHLPLPRPFFTVYAAPSSSSWHRSRLATSSNRRSTACISWSPPPGGVVLLSSRAEPLSGRASLTLYFILYTALRQSSSHALPLKAFPLCFILYTALPLKAFAPTGSSRGPPRRGGREGDCGGAAAWAASATLRRGLRDGGRP